MIRKLWICLGLLFLSFSAVPATAQVTGELTKYAVLEMLVAAHKSQSNKLKERLGIRGTILVETMVEQVETDAFRDKVKKLDKRMCDVMAYEAFAAEVIQLKQLVEKVTRLEKRAIDLSIECAQIDSYFLMTGIRLTQEFAAMISSITARTVYLVSTGLQATMATQEQRMEFTNSMRKDLMVMYNRLNFYVNYAGGVKLIGRMPPVIEHENRFGQRENFFLIWKNTFESSKAKIKAMMKDTYKID